jgi:AraC-like DNA-binding protein
MNSPPDNFFRLSTDQFAERDRIEAARELIGRSLMKMEFDLLPDVPFNVDMVFRVLPDFGLASGTCSAMDCLRTAQMIESDDLILTVALSGVNFRFPFDKIAPMIADLDAAAMRPIPVNTEALRLLVHYASALKNEDMLATPEVQSLISSHLQDLAVLAIGATRDAETIASHRGIPAARLRAIKADIARNFADRDLSIDAVALRNGITPRYVSMLLESDATTFSEFVLTQRLHRAHQMLTDQRWSDRTVSSVAFDAGFGDLSYFNRAFRRRYGATPSDVRRKVRSEQ